MRPLVKTFLLAILAAACLAAIWDVRHYSRMVGPSSPVSLPVNGAIQDQCSVSGATLVSTGNDSKLIWKRFSVGNVWLMVDVESEQSTSLQMFWRTPDTPSFSAERQLSESISTGPNRIVFPLPREVYGIRLDFGNKSGQTFRIHSIVATRGPIRVKPWSWPVFFLRTALLLCPLFLLLVHLFFPADRIWTFVDRYRFPLAACVLAGAVALDVNGSSIAMWNRYVPNDSAQTPLFGQERSIRSDEWAVFTPLTMAQSFAASAWPYFNDIPRAMPTDMYSVYAQPVRHPLLVFRPFLAGHVLFGFSRGLAFFWTSRWLALLLAMYGLFKLLTDNDKPLSAVAALLVMLAPAVQWWGAINALAEMLVFGALFVLCLDRFLQAGGVRGRCWPAIGMGYSGVAYAMTLYPAAMVPLAYVFGALSLWTVCRRIRGFRVDAATLGLLGAVAAAGALCLLGYLCLSADAFRTLSDTVYPGRRFHCGGGLLEGTALSWGNLFFPWTPSWIETSNSFELAMFLDFFPLGLVLFACSSLRGKRLDAASFLLVAVTVFLAVYGFVGFPPWLARVSLMSRSTPNRAAVALSFVQFLLLVRSLAVLRPKPGILAAAAGSAAFACLAVALSRFAYPTYLTGFRLALVGLVAAGTCCSLLQFRLRRKTAAASLVALACAAGAFVNPVQQGDAGILRSDLARTIRGIAERDHGSWLVEGAFPLVQIPLLVGAPTVNAANLYPALSRWRTLDPEEKAKEIWNRYANMVLFELESDGKPAFSPGRAPDQFRVKTSNEWIRRLDVSYVMSQKDLAPLSDEVAQYNLLCRVSGWNIYQVVFPSPDIPSMEPA